MNESKHANHKIRNINIDIIKVIAAFFVIILHLDGTIMPTVGIENASRGVKMTYYSLESISYIAVHLFVLSGSYLMYEKQTTSFKSLLRIYLTTLMVTILGLLVALIVGIHVNVLQIGQCFFPISLRAYGYVSSYIFLMIISPFLNMALQKMTDRQVFYITSVLLIVNMMFPTFIPFIGWGENYTTLFILLYFIAAAIYRFNRSNQNHKKAKWVGACVWIMAVCMLTLSPFLIYKLSKIISYAEGKEEYFYNYQGFLVVASAVSFFIMVSNSSEQIKSNILTTVITSSAQATLVIYIYHMHPIFKRMYPEWSIFVLLYSDYWYIYLTTILGIAVAIYIVGIVAYKIINIPVNWLIKIISVRIKNSEKIKMFLLDCKISV